MFYNYVQTKYLGRKQHDVRDLFQNNVAKTERRGKEERQGREGKRERTKKGGKPGSQ